MNKNKFSIKISDDDWCLFRNQSKCIYLEQQKKIN